MTVELAAVPTEESLWRAYRLFHGGPLRAAGRADEGLLDEGRIAPQFSHPNIGPDRRAVLASEHALIRSCRGADSRRRTVRSVPKFRSMSERCELSATSQTLRNIRHPVSARRVGPRPAIHNFMGIRAANRAAVIQHCEKAGLISTADARDLGCSPFLLRAMHEDGELEKIGRGLYARSRGENQDLAALFQRAPNAFLCGVSAAYIHDLLPESFLVPLWIGIGANDRRPSGYDGALFQYFSGPRRKAFVKTDRLHGAIRFSTAARAVCELFSRSRIVGEKLPRIALRNYVASGRDRSALYDAAALFDVRGEVLAPLLADDVELTTEDLESFQRAMAAALGDPLKRRSPLAADSRAAPPQRP